MDICIILIDVWSLSKDEMSNRRLWNDVMITRHKIADLLHIANVHKVPVFAANASRPYPNLPVDLSIELSKSSLILQDSAFVFDGWIQQPAFNRNGSMWPIVNTIDFRDYKTLVYTGYAADFSVGSSQECGYMRVGDAYTKYIVQDATLCLPSNRSKLTWWEKWHRVKPTDDYIADTVRFCNRHARRFCEPITVRDFKDMVC